MIFLDKWHRDRALTVAHLDGEKKAVYVKRFVAESSTKTVSFIREEEGSKMLLFTDHGAPIVKCKAKDLGEQRFSLNEFIAIKGVKARGKRLSTDARAKVTLEDTPDPNLEATQVEAAAAETAPEAQITNTPPSAPEKGAEGPASDTENPAGGEVQSTLF
jgi:hypothetical protein